MEIDPQYGFLFAVERERKDLLQILVENLQQNQHKLVPIFPTDFLAELGNVLMLQKGFNGGVSAQTWMTHD